MATDQNLEKQPLLRGENVNYNDYVQGRPSAPAYDDSGIPSVSSVHIPTPVPAVQPDELPPPYTTVSGTNAVVTCRVCQVTIDITGKDDKHVVQCSHCNEATPIKSAPPGKKYVRCPCNCLLICKVSSKKISCPRPNCKRIICLSPSAVATSTPQSAGTCQVCCAYCHSSFPVNLVLNNCVRCIYCRKLCALIPEFSRKRALSSIVVGLSALVALIIIAATTHRYVAEYPGIYFAYMLFAALFVAGMLRSIFYFTLKSVIIEPPT